MVRTVESVTTIVSAKKTKSGKVPIIGECLGPK
jgi:hypothetical protein